MDHTENKSYRNDRFLYGHVKNISLSPRPTIIITLYNMTFFTIFFLIFYNLSTVGAFFSVRTRFQARGEAEFLSIRLFRCWKD
jgi:hypothetical protein